MSLSLAVYSCSLRAVKTNSCSLLDSSVRSLLWRQRQLFKVICTTNRRADTGTFHREFHPQEQLAREDPMAAAPATVACTHNEQIQQARFHQIQRRSTDPHLSLHRPGGRLT